jgi:hypothetical protein
MEVGDLILDAAAATGLALLILTLRWAAIERARVHRRKARRQGEQAGAGWVIDWGVAAAAVAGCL